MIRLTKELVSTSDHARTMSEKLPVTAPETNEPPQTDTPLRSIESPQPAKVITPRKDTTLV